LHAFCLKLLNMLRYPKRISTKEKPRFPVQSLVQIERKLGLQHRSRVDIIANILRAANSGAKKTHIMYKCNLSFKQLHVYLDLLKERKLLKCIRTQTEDKNNSYTYETTNKGKEFLQAYSSIRALLSTSELETED